MVGLTQRAQALVHSLRDRLVWWPAIGKHCRMTDHDDLAQYLIMRSEALAAGSSDRELAKLVRSGDLRRIRAGAYAPSRVWDQWDLSQQHRLLARAVLGKAGTPTVLSHVSAAAELGAPTWGLPLDDVHVTRRDGRAGRKEAGVNQHRGRLLADDVVVHGGVPVTSATRLAIDITTIASLESSLCVVNHLLHTNLTDPERLAHRYKSMEQFPHTLRTGLVLRLADPRIETVGETRTFVACWRHGLPAPEPQYEVLDGGQVIARLDFAWPHLGRWLEFDGKQKYVKYLRDGESVTDAVLREKRREERVAELTGWRCIRITWADLEHPVRLARRLLAFLGLDATVPRVTPDLFL